MATRPFSQQPSSRHFATTVTEVDHYDVVVCGGGVAGCVAAIQAAREGARTALIEKNGILGGTAVTAAVNFPGLFHSQEKQVIAGIGWELVQACIERGGASLPDFQQKTRSHAEHQVRINRFVYAALLDEFCLDAHVDLFMHEMPVAVVQNGKDQSVFLARKTGLHALDTKIVIDATGDADVTRMMGYPCERGTYLQPGTLVYNINSYNIADVDQAVLQSVYDAALATGTIKATDHCSTKGKLVPFWRELVRGGGSCNHISAIDGSTSAGRTTAEIKARQSVMRMYRLLRQVPGLEQIQVTFVADECGIRETWRAVGETRVDVGSYTSGYLWPDAICYSYYPIDVHRHNDNTIDMRPLAEGTIPSIPYGALIPQGSDQLLVAGRCISGDSEASSAYRVQASCMATGQAAGAAAALAARNGVSVRSVDVNQIRAVLRKHNAIVPGPHS